MYANQLETNWSAFINAFDEHEKAIAGKDEDELKTITEEYATLHTSFLKARIALAKLSTSPTGANSSFLNISVNNGASAQKTTKLLICTLPKFFGRQNCMG